MKKILIALFFIVFLYSCGGGDKKEENKAASDSTQSEPAFEPVATDSDEQFSIQYKFEKGKKYSYKVIQSVLSNETLTIDSTQNKIGKQTITYFIDLEVLGKKDTVTTLKATIKSATVELDENEKKITYKSGQELNNEEKMYFMNYEAVINSPFTIAVSRSGIVQNIEGLDKAVDKLLVNTNLKDSVNAEQKKLIEKDLEDYSITPLTQQLFRLVPSKPVSLDETWSFDYPSHLMIFKIVNKAKFKVIGKEKINDDELAKIDASLSITWSGKTDYEENGIKYHFNAPEVTGSGTIRYNLTNGLVQHSNTTTQFIIRANFEETTKQEGENKKASKQTVFTSKNVVELL